MSFYGSIYYQAAEAFAKFLIQNAGLSNKSLPENISTEEIAIDPAGRNGEMIFNSGNRWIQLEGDANNRACNIWHGKPDPEGKNHVDALTKPDSLTDAMKDEAVELSLTDDIYLSAPVIYYDDAGHIIVSDNPVKYFKIPKIQIQSSIDSLSEQVEKLTEDVSENTSTLESATGEIRDHNTRLDTLSNQIGYISEMTKGELSITGAIGDMDAMKEVIGANATLANSLATLYKNYVTLLESYQGLSEDIRKIEARLDAINA